MVWFKALCAFEIVVLLTVIGVGLSMAFDERRERRQKTQQTPGRIR